MKVRVTTLDKALIPTYFIVGGFHMLEGSYYWGGLMLCCGVLLLIVRIEVK